MASNIHCFDFLRYEKHVRLEHYSCYLPPPHNVIIITVLVFQFPLFDCVCVCIGTCMHQCAHGGQGTHVLLQGASMRLCAQCWRSGFVPAKGLQVLI